jgi:hypothetical protein
MGSKHLVLPVGDNALTHVRVSEIDKVRVVGGSAGGRFVHLSIVDRKGEYQEIRMTLDAGYAKYALEVDDVDHHDTTITHLPKGVVAWVNTDGTLNVYVPSSGVLKTVDDGRITTNYHLTRWDDTVLAIRKGSLHSIKMK